MALKKLTSATKRRLSITGLVVTGSVAIGGAFLFAIAGDSSPLLIESFESKTKEGLPVFNRIRRFAGPERDVWVMQQSHEGLNDSHEKWDRVAIVVDKNREPMTAKYYQLEPGELAFDENAPKAKFKVSCFLCHANGPRAIRPNPASQLAKLSMWDKGRVWLWNATMKSYGRVLPDEEMSEADAARPPGEIPFRYGQSRWNERLEVKTCTLCHKDSGLFARGTLTRQNFMSIRFLVDNGLMPPLGLPLDETEKEEIRNFLNGRKSTPR